MPEVPYKYFMTVSSLDGKLYISDYQTRRIIRVKTMGAVRELTQNYEVIAGTGEQCIPGDADKCGDGGLAINARLSYPKGRVDHHNIIIGLVTFYINNCYIITCMLIGCH